MEVKRDQSRGSTRDKIRQISCRNA